jgi:Transposase IS116/IS110/IS902 family
VRRRAEHYDQQLDALRSLRQEVRRDLLVESKKHQAWKLLRRIPGIGPIRAALLIALIQTPHRFRTKGQLWTYSGLGLETHDSAQYSDLRPEEHHSQIESARSNSWAECRDKKGSAPTLRGDLSLDIPLYRTPPVSALIRT